MELARLKRWHWMLIGVAVGLLIGYVRSITSNDVDAQDIREGISQFRFEQALARPIHGTQDRLQIKDITVYRVVEQGQVSYVATLMYVYTDSVVEGMRNGKLRAADAPYRLHAYRPTDSELREALAAIKKKSGGAAQEKSEGIVASLRRICETLYIKPADPPGGLLEYLRLVTDFKGRHVDFTYAWWNQPRVQLTAWSVAGFVGVGLIWPTIVNLIAFGKFFRPAEKKSDKEKAYEEKEGVSLWKVKSRPAAPVKKATGPSRQEMEKLVAMEDEMEARLKAAGMEMTPAAPAAAVPAGPATKLAGTETALPELPEGSEEDKHFDRKTGDYYPVERHLKKDDEPEQ